MTKPNRDNCIIAGIFIGAFIVRLIYLYFLQKNYFFYDYPSDDVAYYQTWADQIRAGGWLGKDIFYGMPLYPYFLAVLKGLTLNHLFLIRLAHLMLGSINCVLVYILTKKIFSQKVALLAAFFTVTNFMLIYYDWLMMPVTLLIFLSLVVILGLIEFDEKTESRKWFMLGIFVGLGTLGDGKFLIFLSFLVAYYVFLYRSQLKYITKTLLPLGLGALIVLLGVGFRNWVVGGNFVLLSAHSGINFYIGNNPAATGFFENPNFLRPTHEGHENDAKILAETALKRRLTQKETSDFWKEKAVSFIKNSPQKYFTLLINKFANFWTDTEKSYDIDLLLQKDLKNKFDINSFWLIVPLALLGIMASFQKTRGTVFLNFIILSQLIFTLIFFLINRHRATILPFLIIFEAYFIFWLAQQIRSRNFSSILLVLFATSTFFWIFRPTKINPQTLQFLEATKRGFILADKKEYNKAREEYFRALQLQPFDTNTLYNLANSYVVENNFPGAIKYYERAVKLSPYDTDILYNLAFAYEQTNLTEKAIHAYEYVIQLQPQSLDAHLRLANVLGTQHRCTEAISHYEFIKKSAPSYQKELDPLIKNCKN